MRNIKLILAYDGTDFSGWQVQPDAATVQGTLASAIGRITGEKVLPQGSGRTDAGVHALAQVATFQTESTVPGGEFLGGAKRYSCRPRFVCWRRRRFPPNSILASRLWRRPIATGFTAQPFARRFSPATSGTILIRWMKTPCSRPRR